MRKSREVFETSTARSIFVGVALSCLGAAVVFASPIREGLSLLSHPTVQQVSYVPLAQGPAVSLSRSDGSDEDCVEVTKVAAPPASPYGALYLPHHLSCGE
jgi:hypothetical protein